MYLKNGDLAFGDKNILQKNSEIENQVIKIVRECSLNKNVIITSETNLEQIASLDLIGGTDVKEDFKEFLVQLRLAISEAFVIPEITNEQLKNWTTVGDVVTFVILNSNE